MADPPINRQFPHDDALCEACGYPLNGLAEDAKCPECGSRISNSSPLKRDGLGARAINPLFQYGRVGIAVLLSPRCVFRKMQVNGDRDAGVYHLLITAVLTPLALFVGYVVCVLVNVPSAFRNTNVEPILLFLMALVLSLIILALSYIEMLGVTAFSRRRGWRVPFRLAERVCCYASVGWLPGVFLAGVGIAILDLHAVGQPWFEKMHGLVRVRWIFYAALFVLSLLWFETLVWIGVRQVRYANAWPEEPDAAVPGTPEQ